ncbi:hypothetical protein BDV93DRAFT_243144 [Ceratobasidium sp. AG-I]|nr:hypothetical protein BDV93DRAFT_243144 [Ceratobasidium sp. AG-I]
MGKVQGQPSPPQSIGTSDPVRRPRSPRAFAGVSTSASSNGVSPLAEQVARTYSVPAEEIPPLQKSLYKPGHFDVLPPARSGLDTPSCDQNVQPSTTINTYPESAAPISHPNRVPQVPKTIPNGFPWRLPPGFDPRKLAFRLPDRDPDRAPGLRALLMSNNAPPGHEDWLRFAEADVERFMRCLIQHFNVKVENIRVVKTVQDVRPVSDGFRWLFAGVISGDALILLISSHVQLNGIDDLVQFFHYNAQDFFAYINNLPRGCSLEILLDTCFGTKLIRLEHVVKRIGRNVSSARREHWLQPLTPML